MTSNTSDLVGSFLASMMAAGITPANAGAVAADLLSGQLVRFACHGERKPNGWAVLFLDRFPAGAFGNWRLGRSATWRPGGCTPLPTRARIAHLVAIRDAERRAVQTGVAELAAERWAAAGPACINHPYLRAKRMTGEGLRQSGQALLVPMHDGDGRLWNLQRIMPDGAKRFLKGGRVAGLCWQRGRLADEAEAPLVIGEGVATMAAVNAATGLPVVAAFSAGNLAAIASMMAKRHPTARLILAADMDVNGTGQRAAREAAKSIGAGVAYAPRPPGWPANASWDFADAWTQTGGCEAIRCSFLGLTKSREAGRP